MVKTDIDEAASFQQASLATQAGTAPGSPDIPAGMSFAVVFSQGEVYISWGMIYFIRCCIFSEHDWYIDY